ncbi:MAG: hypothetical protein QHJ82_10355 [Verrucomicrobiota bacterium]|nr:hypothetical protein [Verrucomicrobiota bacterium]
MNTASENLPHHLTVLRERMMLPDSYELAAAYFLEEFVADKGLLDESEPAPESFLNEALKQVVATMLDRPAELDEVMVLSLSEYKFFYGAASFEDRAMLFFYFEEEGMGVFTVMPGSKGGVDVGRFELPSRRLDPQRN